MNADYKQVKSSQVKSSQVKFIVYIHLPLVRTNDELEKFRLNFSRCANIT